MTERMGYLFDTNAISETRRKQRHPNFQAFYDSVEPEQIYLSVLTLGEIQKGIYNRQRRGKPALAGLDVWADSIDSTYSGRILHVDMAVATLWGELSADRSRPAVDTLLAATALVHGLTLITRNVRDLDGLPVKWHNPWAA